jgi:hypothetical protein
MNFILVVLICTQCFNSLPSYIISFTLSITFTVIAVASSVNTNRKAFFLWIGYLCFSIFSFIFHSSLLSISFFWYISVMFPWERRTNIFCASCVFPKKVEGQYNLPSPWSQKSYNYFLMQILYCSMFFYFITWIISVLKYFYLVRFKKCFCMGLPSIIERNLWGVRSWNRL